jgi:apolipoprotein N-acyltransferase
VRFGPRRIARSSGLALLGVVLFCGYALAPSLSFLPYVALVPWAILYTDPRRPTTSPGYFLCAGYLCWILCYTTTFRFGELVPLVMALFFVPAWLLFPLLARPIQRLGLPRSITLPVVWVTFEWARLLLASAHFDLFALGYSQARFTPLVQIADVTGVYGVSFLVAAVNGLLADAWFALKEASFRPRILLREQRIVVPAMALVSAFVVAFSYGFYKLESTEVRPGPRVAVVPSGNAEAGDVDLIVWPQSALGDELDANGGFLDTLTWLDVRKRAPALLGAQGQAPGLVGRTTSSAFLVDEGGALCGRYDKQILFPYVEYVPFDNLAGRIDPAAQRAYRRLVRKSWGFLSSGTPGRAMTLFALPWEGGTIPFAAVISMESSYPPLVAEAGRRGARFLVNLSGDDEPSGVIEEQLLRVSMLRAVENRIGYLRASNTGISAFIDPRGRLLSVRDGAGGASTDVSGVLTGIVALSYSGPTVYTESHDAFALVCVAVSLWLLARAILRGPGVMTPHPVHAEVPAT